MNENEKQEQIQNALNRAYFYLKFRPRTDKEVQDYLQKKAEKFHWASSVVTSAISSLKENKYIDDDAFVEWFVNQRSSGKPKSSFALNHELQKLGIQKDIISKFFEENPIHEEDLALTALQRRWNRFRYLDKKTRFEKAAQFLMRRGFKFEIIKKAINSLENPSEI